MTNEARRMRLEICLAADTQAKPETRLLPAGSEQRFCAASIRSETTSGSRYAIGHAAVFGKLSRDLGKFKERIQRGAFSRAIAARQDTKFLLNHDPAYLIARIKNNSLQLREDSLGLYFKAEIPDTTAGNDLEEMLDQGLIDECSFAFTVSEGQRWSREISPDTSEMIDVRTLTDVDELYDCSAVVEPAYFGTDVQAASRALWPGSGQMPAELRSRLRTNGPMIDEVQLNRRRRLRLREALLTL